MPVGVKLSALLPNEEHDVVVRGIHEEENEVDPHWDGAQKHHDGPNITTIHKGIAR